MLFSIAFVLHYFIKKTLRIFGLININHISFHKLKAVSQDEISFILCFEKKALTDSTGENKHYGKYDPVNRA